MSRVEITVAVAACGRPEGLSRCLAALAAQTRPATEVIVVDQAPSEAGRALAAANGLEPVRYLEQPRRGLSASRNLALHSARSALLAVTDDDCVPDAGWLAAIAQAFEAPSRPGAVTGPVLPLGSQPQGMFAVSLRDESNASVDHAGRIQPWGVGTGANFAARTDMLRRHGGWDERLGVGSGGQAAEDADLVVRLLEDGEVVRYEPTAIVRHAWQTRERLIATSWSYGFGVGAMCGLRLARRDPFGIRLLAGYVRLHVRPLIGALLRREGLRAHERIRNLTGTVPGLIYGLRSARRPPRVDPGAGAASGEPSGSSPP